MQLALVGHLVDALRAVSVTKESDQLFTPHIHTYTHWRFQCNHELTSGLLGSCCAAAHIQNVTRKVGYETLGAINTILLSETLSALTARLEAV